MRLYEFESKVKPEVYIDMDGVLVDFFDAWAKLMGEKDFRDIKDVAKGLQAIRDEDDFWLKLKPTPNAGKLLALVRELKGSYTILSSPLADDPRSEPHKRMWVEKNLKQFPPKKVIITGNKAKYAQQSDGTPNILIDDFGQNIDKWNAAGGIGVKHKDHKFERTLQSLKQHLSKDEKVKEDQLNEIAWVIPAIVGALRLGAPIVKKLITSNGAKQVAKTVARGAGKGTEIVVKNPGKALLGYGAYETFKTLEAFMEWLEQLDIVGLAKEIALALGKVVVKHGIPIAVVIAVLLGGWKLIKTLTGSDDQRVF